MPIYRYQCTNAECEHEFKELSKHDDPDPECPECEGETKKLISAPSFKLEGPGFHVNDYPE
jgi:putative FmdB family regulatory protein